MIGINKAIILGRLGKDPESKSVSSNQTITKFTIATNERWIGKDGNTHEKTDWHNVIAWGKLGESCAKYLTKGSAVYVEGKIETRQYEDKTGELKYITEIKASDVQFLDKQQVNHE